MILYFPACFVRNFTIPRIFCDNLFVPVKNSKEVGRGICPRPTSLHYPNKALLISLSAGQKS